MTADLTMWMTQFGQVSFSSSMILMPWFWWSCAGILLIAELTIDANYYLLWAGLSAVIIGVIQWLFPMLTVGVTMPLYGIMTLSILFFWHVYIKKNPPAPSDQPWLNLRGAEHVGTTVVLDHDLPAGEGEIRFHDTLWKTQSGAPFRKGDRVLITKLDGKVYHLEAKQ